MTKVTVSRYWNNPEITTTVTNHGISIEMDLDDFLDALKPDINNYFNDMMFLLKEKIGSVFWTFKQDTFHKQFDTAILNIKQDSLNKIIDDSAADIVKKMKQETVKVL